MIISPSSIVQQISDTGGALPDNNSESEISYQSGRLEMGNQVGVTYKSDSLIFDKYGELIVAMHLPIDALHSGKLLKVLSCLIHKLYSAYFIEVTLSEQKMEVQETIIADSPLSGKVLCKGFDCFLRIE